MGAQISSLLNVTVVGWTLVIGGGFMIYVLHRNEQQKKALKQSTHRLKGQDREASQLKKDKKDKKDTKAKQQRKETFANEAKQAQSKIYASAASVVQQAKPSSLSSDDGADNRAFAEQMARNKENKFTQKQGPVKQKQKSVKQSKAKAIGEDADVGAVSAPSSTAGIDADDDQSSVASPPISAADVTGVSDMLEQQSSGPSVLRLTGTEEKQTQKPKQAKAPQPTETKKQRQNRKKREQERAAREEEEKERKVKEEAQRRAARLADGRAAKDGVAFEASQRANAWAGNVTNGNSAQRTAAVPVQPLDTYDSAPQAAAAPVAATNGKENSKQNGKKTDWAAEVPFSEEEQMAMLQKQDEEDNQWVSVKSRKNKRANPGVANSETSESANEASAPTPAAAQQAPKTKPAATNGRPKPQTMNTQSSFAALNDDGADLEEQEWDV